MQSKQLAPFVLTRGSTWMLMALAGGVHFAVPTDATAQDATWTGPGNEWTTSSNWTPATPTNNARFTNNGAPTAVNISGNATIETMEFTAAAPAYSFNVTAGASFTVNTAINSASPALPNFQVNLGSTLTLGEGADIAIGSLGNGTAGGGTIAIGSTNPTSYLTIAGGTTTTFSGSFSGAGSLELANTSTTLTLTGSSNGGNIGTIGSDLVLCDCYFGGLTISGGALTVDAGFGGFGVAVFGGTLSVVNGGGLQTNGRLGIASTMAISGPGSTVTVAADTFVGGGTGPATLTISNAGTLNSQRVAVVDGFFDTATVTVTGPGSTWNVGTDGLLVGDIGVGVLSISNGGQVNVSAAGIGIGDLGPGTSAVTVTGSGSALTTSGLIALGQTGLTVGTLTAADGGVVTAAAGMTIGAGSTLNLGTGGLSGALVTPAIVNDGAIVANFTNTLTLAANITGTGTLSKAGSGILTLTGNNDYSGGTTVTGGLINFSTPANLGTGAITLNGGGLQWAAGNTSDISAQLAAIGSGGATFDTGGNNVSFSAALSGPGGITKAGNGTLTLAAVNGYAGDTTINGGTLAVTSDATLGTVGGLVFGGGTLQLLGTLTSARSVTLNAGGGTVDTNGNSATLSGDISGAGGLTKSGIGTLILSGNNNYTGGTTVSGGVLQGTTTSLQGNILNNATVAFNQACTGTYAGNMSGSGGLLINGTGTVILAGTNNYTGGTTVSGGILQGNTLSLQGNILNNASVVFDQTGTGTYAGIMSGGGSLTKSGIGTLILSGNNNYTGGTTVSGGILQGTTSSLQGNIVNNAAVVFAQASNGTYAGVMSGTGGLTLQGGGTLTLTGANGYQGGTAINGGTIAVGNASALGTGVVSLNGGNLTGVANVTLGNNIAFNAATGVIAAAAGTTLTLAPNTFSFGLIPNTVFTFGSATDTGTVVYQAGTSFLTNVAFSTVVSGGTLRAGNATLASFTGNDRNTTIVNAGATLDFNDFSSAITNLQGAGSVVTGVAAGTVLTVASGDFGGVIGGAGQLVKTGTGTLTLTGANTYSGGTTVNGGVLQGTTASLQGDIANNAAVVFSQSGTGTYAGNMSGTGSLTLLGGGVILSGNNSYTGGTTVSGGILQGDTASLQGNIANNASVVFDQAGNGIYTGNMSGFGSLTKIGPGTLILSGNNTYSGGTTVSGGVLQGTTTSLQGNILNNATVAFNQAGTGTYAGNMSGSGGLLINGTGTVILAGANSYTGGTTVSGGVLQGNTSSLQGNILNNAAVTFNQTGTGTYAGVMSGTGGMTLQGGGVLAMTGTNTYSGNTTVNASTLVVNGSLTSSVTLNNGSILGGIGSIGALAINGGVIAPGNSIGTLTVNGNFIQNGGAYVVEANAQGQSDRVNVNGNTTINSATVQVVAASGSYANSTTYTILNATGGVSGAYSGVSSNFAFLTPSLSYDANNVFLTLALQGAAFSGFGGNTVNQRNVGYVLDQTFANASGDYATVIAALAGLSTSQAPAALDAISGQPYADFGTTNVAGASLFMNTLGQQMALARSGSAPGARVALAQACEVATCDEARPLSAWFSGLGGLGSVQGDGNSSTLTYNVGGAAAGIDYRFDPRFLVGVGIGYAHGTQWVNSFMGRGWTDSVSVAAYGSFTQAGFYADALAGYAYINNQLQRQIQIPNLQQRTASGSTGANQFLAQVETGYKIGVWDMASLTPFARFQTSSTTQNAFTESGANSLNLNVAQQTTTSVRTVLGAEFASSIPLGSERALGLSLRLGWQHEYANTARPITASFAGAPSPSFTVYGATPTRDAALVGFSASTNVAAATQLYLRYDGELASGTDNHAFTAGLRMSW